MIVRLLRWSRMYFNYHKGYLCILLLCTVFSLNAQQYNFHEYPDQLAQPYIYTITQGIHGYLWIGTGNGLSRFDGINFTSYTTRDSLAGNFIACSYSDGDNIWFGHMNGRISLYDGKKFQAVLSENLKSGITDIEKSPDGEIWASSYSDGLVRLDQKAGISVDTTAENQVTIFSFVFLTGNEILAGSVDGLNLCSINKTGKVKLIRHIDKIPDAKIADIIRTKDSTGFYVATGNDGIFKLIPRGGQFGVQQIGTALNLDFSGVQHIFEDRESNLWISTFGEGLIELVRGDDGHFKQVRRFDKSTGFSTNDVKTAFEDREGNIWSGNYGTGLTQITRKAFSLYTFDDGHYGSSVYSVLVHNNDWWLGTEKGLLKMSRTTGEVLKFFSSGQGLPQDKITVLYLSKGDTLWIGTERNGLFLMKMDKEEIHHFKIGGGILENSITAITGNVAKVWVGTKKGVCNIDLSSGKTKWYTMVRGQLPHNYVNDLLLDTKNRLWITTRSNILAYIKGNKIKKIPIFSEKAILSLGPIVEENDSTIWVGSDGSGIFLIGSDSIANITTKQGLLSDFCYSMFVDNDNNLWVGHRGGLSKIRTSDFFVKPIQQYAGIKNNCDFNANAVFKGDNNKILFGSSEGLWVYDPAQDNRVLASPLLNITSIWVNDEQIPYSRKLVLPPGNYKIKIEFLGISLKEPTLVSYQYQMLGYDRSPENTKENSVIYPHVNDGKYTFILQAFSGDGIPAKSPLTISVLIKTPIWKQWWFYVLSFLILTVALVAYIKRRDYKHLREKKILEEKVSERTMEISEKNVLLEKRQKKITQQNSELERYRNYLEDLVNERTKELLEAKNRAEESDRLKTAFLNNLSHEIRTPLNAICGFSGLLDDESLTKEERQEFITTISTNADSLLLLFNEILDISRIDAGQFELTEEKFRVDDLLIDLENHYNANNDKSLEFEFTNKDQSGELELYCDKQRFLQIFNNLLGNAYKFTETGFIKFGYKISEQSAHFYVSDTGIGIDRSVIDKIFSPFYKVEGDIHKLYRGAGVGLTSVKKMVELMGGKIWVESFPNRGATFHFTLPMAIEHATPDAPNKKTTIDKDILKGICVLVAEDDTDNYILVSRILERYGAEIMPARDGQEAIDFIKARPDIKNCIVLMDIKMPNVDGFEAHRQIKEINSAIPVVAFTAYASTTDIQKLVSEKFDDYVTKPVSAQALLRVILKTLKKS